MVKNEMQNISLQHIAKYKSNVTNLQKGVNKPVPMPSGKQRHIRDINFLRNFSSKNYLECEISDCSNGGHWRQPPSGNQRAVGVVAFDCGRWIIRLVWLEAVEQMLSDPQLNPALNDNLAIRQMCKLGDA
jgi:hypothetical protein